MLLETGLDYYQLSVHALLFENNHLINHGLCFGIMAYKIYFFICSGVLPESPYMYQLLGLNLMSLLAQNRLGEFHTVSITIIFIKLYPLGS